jgi:hypothetical protein
MKRFKRALRLFGFILLIVLASFGIGIGGGAPIPPSTRKKDPVEVISEEVDSEKSNESESKVLKEKN